MICVGRRSIAQDLFPSSAEGMPSALGSGADACFMITWRIWRGSSCSSRPITLPFARSRILSSSTTLPLLAHAGEQVLAFRDFNERVNQVTRRLTKQGLSVRLGDIAVGGARRDYAMDLRMSFILEKLV